MTTRYPGAHWMPTGDAGAMSGLRGCSWHEAVTRGTCADIAGWVTAAKAAHAFNGKDGDFAQYMDIGRRAYGVAEGNATMLTVESYDGLKIYENPYHEVGIGGIYGDSANTGRWDAGQCERASDFMAWLHIDYGIPLQMMPDSRPFSVGHAPHRWGIAPWRVDGGQSWTAHDGKPCPGDLRVAQLPGIVARANVIADAVKAGRCSYLPPGPVNMGAALARTQTPTPPPVQPAPSPALPAPATDTEEHDMYLAQTRDDKGREVWATVDAGGARYIDNPTALADLRKFLPTVRVTPEWYNANRAPGTNLVKTK